MSLGYLSTIVRTMSICSMVRFTAAGPVIEAGMNTDQNCAPSCPLRLRGMSVISEILPTPPPRVLPCRFVVSAARSMLPTLSKPLRIAPGRSLWPSVSGVRVSTRSTRFCSWASLAVEGAPWANAANGTANSRQARRGSLVMAWSGSGGMNPQYCRFTPVSSRGGGTCRRRRRAHTSLGRIMGLDRPPGRCRFPPLRKKTAMPTALDTLYPEHLRTLRARADRVLARAGYDHLLIGAGLPPLKFLDDQDYPFVASPW